MIFAMLVVVSIINSKRFFWTHLTCKEQPEQEAHQYHVLSNRLTTCESTDPNTATAAPPHPPSKTIVSPATKKTKIRILTANVYCVPAITTHCTLGSAHILSFIPSHTPGGGYSYYPIFFLRNEDLERLRTLSTVTTVCG